MKIAVLGATGMTGGLVVKQALDQGHEVAALVRDPSKLTLQHPRLRVEQGSPISPADVERCLAGVDVVIHCLGIGGKGDGKQTTLVSDSVRVVIERMKHTGVRRLVCMSNVGAGGSGTWLANHVVIPIFLRWLIPIIEDKDRMETALRESDLQWASVRLPAIVDGPEKPIRMSANGRGIGLSITAASAARFLLTLASASNFTQSTPSISN